jgi:hypothetical protein
MLANVPKLITAYYADTPDPSEPRASTRSIRRALEERIICAGSWETHRISSARPWRWRPAPMTPVALPELIPK